jgi:hypothetical protein
MSLAQLTPAVDSDPYAFPQAMTPAEREANARRIFAEHVGGVPAIAPARLPDEPQVLRSLGDLLNILTESLEPFGICPEAFDETGFTIRLDGHLLRVAFQAA